MDRTPVLIHREPIELGQFIKMALGFSGGDAKTLIREGHVYVNGQVEERRSHRLDAGDLVDLGEYGRFEVVIADLSPIEPSGER